MSATPAAGDGSQRAPAACGPVLLLALLPIELAFLVVMGAATSFLLGGSLHAYHFAASLAAVLATPLALSRGCALGWRRALAVTLGFLLLLVLALALAGSFYDVSWDGQVYHQEAIIQLAQGWNPVYQDVGDEVLDTPLMVAQINNFTTGPWVLAAAVYQATGIIEQGKVFHFLFMLAALLACYHALRSLTPLGRPAAWLVAGLAALAPVSLTQMFSYYVDGQLGSLFLAVLAAGAVVLGRGGRIVLLLMLMAAVVALGTKFTAVAYLGVLGLFFVLATLLPGLPTTPRARRALPAVGLAFVLGMGWVDYHPYVTHLLQGRNPFYPVLGAERVDMLGTQRPRDFQEHGRLYRLLHSIFGVADNAMGERPSELKLPLTLRLPREYYAASAYDLRVAGWGPLFSGALLLAFLGPIVAARSLWADGPPARGFALLTVALLATVLINPEAWWARFAPQLYLLPLLLCLWLLCRPGLPRRPLAVLVLLILVANALLVGAASLQANLAVTGRINAQLAKLQLLERPVEIDFGDFRSHRVRLRAAGIEFHEVRDPAEASCTLKYRPAGTQAMFCFPDQRPDRSSSAAPP